MKKLVTGLKKEDAMEGLIPCHCHEFQCTQLDWVHGYGVNED